MKQRGKYVWLVAYIDKAFLDEVHMNNAMRKLKRGKGEITPYIPTIRVLKKTLKNEQHFEVVPFLLNYGFFRVPRYLAVYQSFLDDLKLCFGCIHGWVRDNTKDISMKRSDSEEDEWEFPDSQIPCATATDEEVEEIKHAAYYSSLFSSEDLNSFKAGQVVVLKGYPYENVMAEIVEIIPKKQVVKVAIEMFQTRKVVEVKYENVFFTIYHNRNWDDSLSSLQSIELLNNTTKNEESH